MRPLRPASPELSFLSLFKIVALALGVVVLWLIRDIVLYCFLAVLLAGVIYPLAEWGARHKIPKTVSVLFVYFLIFGLLALIITLLVPALIDQSKALIELYGSRLGGAAESLQDMAFLNQIEAVGIDVTSGIKGLQGQAQAIFGGAFSTLTSIFGGIAGFVVVLVLALYMVIEDSAIKKLFHEWVPKGYQEFATSLVSLIMQKLGAWMRGQLLLCLIVGVLYLVAFAVIGVPYALLLAVLGGIFEFVPYIGPILSAFPVVLIAFTKSPTIGIAAIIALVVVQQLENNLIVPKVMQRSVGLNPIISIVAFLIGAKLFGAVGAIIAIPVAVAASVVVSEWQNFRHGGRASSRG